MINWKQLRTDIEGLRGTNSPLNLPNVPEVQKMKDNLRDYPKESIEWLNLYPGRDFSNEYVEQFADLHNLTHCRSWISIVHPGKMAPWHWDWDSNLADYEKLGTLVRYSVSLGDSIGHTLMIENQTYSYMEIGTEVLWPDYKAWHGAANFGFEPHYLFHFLGYQ